MDGDYDYLTSGDLFVSGTEEYTDGVLVIPYIYDKTFSLLNYQYFHYKKLILNFQYLQMYNSLKIYLYLKY